MENVTVVQGRESIQDWTSWLSLQNYVEKYRSPEWMLSSFDYWFLLIFVWNGDSNFGLANFKNLLILQIGIFFPNEDRILNWGYLHEKSA